MIEFQIKRLASDDVLFGVLKCKIGYKNYFTKDNYYPVIKRGSRIKFIDNDMDASWEYVACYVNDSISLDIELEGNIGYDAKFEEVFGYTSLRDGNCIAIDFDKSYAVNLI